MGEAGSPLRLGLGLRAKRGGALLVVMAVGADGPACLFSGEIHTAAPGDRLAFEPFHVAREHVLAAGDDSVETARRLVADGLRRQAETARRQLAERLSDIRVDAPGAVRGGLLVNRAGWITDLLAHSLIHPSHPPVVEALAVRDSLRRAMEDLGAPWSEWDEKTVLEAGSERTGLDRTALEARLKALRPVKGAPWPSERRLAALAAWLAATT